MTSFVKYTAVACLFAASLVSGASKIEAFQQYKKNLDIKTFLGGQTGTEIPVIGVVSQTLEEEMHNDTRFNGY